MLTERGDPLGTSLAWGSSWNPRQAVRSNRGLRDRARRGWSGFSDGGGDDRKVSRKQECSANEIDPGASASVICSTGHRDTPTQAVDSLPVPTDLIAVVTADGISEMAFRYGSLDCNHVGDPLTAWMGVNHSDNLEDIEFGIWPPSKKQKRTVCSLPNTQPNGPPTSPKSDAPT
jgi:hypothetical protein